MKILQLLPKTVILILLVSVNIGAITAEATPVLSDPVARIYKKISVDSIRRTEDTNNWFSIANYEKETEVLKIQEEYLAEDHQDICVTKLGLTMLSFRLNKFQETIEFGESTIMSINSFNLDVSDEYLITLYANLASAYQLLHNYEMANKAYNTILGCSLTDEMRAFVLNDVAGNFLQQNNIKEGKNAYLEAKAIAETLNSNTLDNVLQITAASLYRLSGEFQKSLSAIESLIDNGLFESNEPYFSDKIRFLLTETAMWSYHMLGDDQKAMKYGQVFNDLNNFDNIDKLTLATWLLNYSIVQSAFIDTDRPDGFPDITDEKITSWIQRFKEPLDTKTIVYNIYKDCLGENSDEALNVMSSMASLLGQIGAFKDCVEICADIINLCEQANKTNSGFYQLALQLICGADLVSGNYWKGDSLSIPYNIISNADKLKESLDINGTKYTNNVFWLTLTDIYIKYKEFDKAADCLINHYKYQKKFISNNLLQIEDIHMMSKYWESISYSLLSGIEVQELWNNPKIKGIFYDKALLYKGMKLELFNALYDEKKKDFLLNLSWTNIKSALQTGEAAIEIVRTLDYEEDGSHNTPSYYALILTNDIDAPELKYICKESELFDYNPLEYYNSSYFTNCLFGVISDYLDKNQISTVYFSSMGEYCNIAIENLITPNGKRLSEKYNMVRLSSTRNLYMSKHQSSQQLIAFGDIDFDADLSNIAPSTGEREDDYQTNTLQMNRLKRSLRGEHYSKLKGTRIELDSIAQVCHEKDFFYQEYKAEKASEIEFRGINNSKDNILHIATHGFLWNGSNNYNKTLASRVLSNEVDFIEDLSMFNSGILFAGANKALKSDSVTEISNDGIMTAYEISHLLLSNVDLVVLSACETGLGAIKGDGVFGLQRGFKQAGVNSIMMSLWEVDDDATQILMTEFYRNFLNGKSKRESLLAAQKVVRETPGFEDPEYWAAFILLDALN